MRETKLCGPSVCVSTCMRGNQTEYKVVPDVVSRPSQMVERLHLKRIVEVCIGAKAAVRPTLHLEINLPAGGCAIEARTKDTEIDGVSEPRPLNIEARCGCDRGHETLSVVSLVNVWIEPDWLC